MTTSLRLFFALSAALMFGMATIPATLAMGSCGPIAANPGGTKTPKALKDYEQKLVEALNEVDVTAGFAIAIVKDGQVLYARGFGFSDLGTCSPVTADTGFYLLSTTKSFTGMTAAVLQEDGVVDLDQSLAHYFPDLQNVEGINWGQVSVRSLLTHGKTFSNSTINYRTFAPGNLPDDQLLDVLQTFSDPKPPTFEYSNTGYVLAGYVMQTVTGTSWRDLLTEKIFTPLGMANTTATMAEALTRDYARPYYRDPDGKMVPGFQKTDSQMHAAGGVVSTANDLGRWLIANLDQGRIDGHQVLPARAVRQAHVPQIQLDRTYYKFHRFGYAFGVYNADYEGDLLIHHFGGAIHVSFMPEHDLGVVVLTSNTGQGAGFAHAAAALAYDTLLGKSGLDQRWQDEMNRASESIEKTLDRYRSNGEYLASLVNPDDQDVPDADLTGTYHNDRLGDMVIEQGENGLTLTWGAIIDQPKRLDGNTFTAFLIPLDLTPPQPFDIREDEALGWVLDWEGRIFVRQ